MMVAFMYIISVYIDIVYVHWLNALVQIDNAAAADAWSIDKALMQQWANAMAWSSCVKHVSNPVSRRYW